ncbi:hypothetical protein [Paenibacillus massiliensis]|uniref:hypothetical protein n=1 Tax=Paenibacillus massiliensis TaxID=225917 RepID=UPI000470E286|nr:hypothetical protein [Paenibacillus massiliensis]
MDIQFTCYAVKYDPGEDLKTNVALIFNFNIEVQVLNGFVHKLIDAHFYLPIKPIEYVENNVAKFGEYTCGFPTSACIEFIDRNNFKLHFKRNSIPGFLTEKTLLELGVTELQGLIKENTTISALFTNYQYGQENSEEMGAIYIPRLKTWREK